MHLWASNCVRGLMGFYLTQRYHQLIQKGNTTDKNTKQYERTLAYSVYIFSYNYFVHAIVVMEMFVVYLHIK